MQETKCPLRVTAQVSLISCQIIQNAANPLNLSTGREKNPRILEREFMSSFESPQMKATLNIH